jgi:predicted DNA-binding protein
MNDKTYITTVRLPRSLEKPLKARAASDGRTVSSYVSMLLRRHLQQPLPRTRHASKD